MTENFSENEKGIKTSKTSLGIFIATFGVVLISFIPVVFPALLTRTLGGFEDHMGVNSLDLGTWSIPFLVTNCIIFGLLLLYKKNKLPNNFLKGIKLLFKFEISPKIAFLIVAVLIGGYIVFSIPEVFNDEYEDDFYHRGQVNLENYDITNINAIGTQIPLFFGKLSGDIFDNYKIIPFFGSVTLLMVTYFVTQVISNKRFSGIVAMIIVMQSGIFLKYDTSVVYPNFWILFYLLSLYLIYRKWPISIISYILSVLSKSLTTIFFPVNLFFIYKSTLTKKKKILISSSYGAFIVLVLSLYFFEDIPLQQGAPEKDFSSHDLWTGFAAMNTSLRLDGLVILFLLPLVVGLFIASKKGILQAETISLLIFGMLLQAPLIVSITVNQNTPYRIIPLIVFFAMGVGILLSKRVPLKATN